MHKDFHHNSIADGSHKKNTGIFCTSCLRRLESLESTKGTRLEEKQKEDERKHSNSS